MHEIVLYIYKVKAIFTSFFIFNYYLELNYQLIKSNNGAIILYFL